MDDEAPRHRTFRFGLRTGFALLTLACLVAAWVGFQLNWIRQRHAAMRELSDNKLGYYWELKVNPKTHAPGMLWLFGETGKAEFVLYVDPHNSPDIQRIQALFPEAHFVVGKLAQP